MCNNKKYYFKNTFYKYLMQSKYFFLKINNSKIIAKLFLSLN